MQLQAALEISRRYLHEKIHHQPPLQNSQLTKDYLISQLRPHNNEIFACLFLDSQHRVIHFEKLFTGTINKANIHPRTVVKRALDLNTAAIIFAHNHPSGEARPSQADIQLTKFLIKALDMVDIRVLDHIIVGDHLTASFAELGLM